MTIPINGLAATVLIDPRATPPPVVSHSPAPVHRHGVMRCHGLPRGLPLSKPLSVPGPLLPSSFLLKLLQSIFSEGMPYQSGMLTWHVCERAYSSQSLTAPLGGYPSFSPPQSNPSTSPSGPRSQAVLTRIPDSLWVSSTTVVLGSISEAEPLTVAVDPFMPLLKHALTLQALQGHQPITQHGLWPLPATLPPSPSRTPMLLLGYS